MEFSKQCCIGFMPDYTYGDFFVLITIFIHPKNIHFESGTRVLYNITIKFDEWGIENFTRVIC